MNKIETHICPDAPFALGAYSHAVSYGDLLFVSGIAARDPVTNELPGLKKDAQGRKIAYDITAEARGTMENLKRILAHAGSAFDHVLEVNVYLLDMKDFAAYNAVYADYFTQHKPARTTIGVASLPGDIAIEIKMVAVRKNRVEL